MLWDWCCNLKDLENTGSSKMKALSSNIDLLLSVTNFLGTFASNNPKILSGNKISQILVWRKPWKWEEYKKLNVLTSSSSLHPLAFPLPYNIIYISYSICLKLNTCFRIVKIKIDNVITSCGSFQCCAKKVISITWWYI